MDWIPEFSRRARGFPIYAAIRSLGRDGDRRAGRALLRPRAPLRASCSARSRSVEILNDVVLNQVLVRFGDDDAVTQATVRGVQEDGTCWLSGTEWQGRGGDADLRLELADVRGGRRAQRRRDPRSGRRGLGLAPLRPCVPRPRGGRAAARARAARRPWRARAPARAASPRARGSAAAAGRAGTCRSRGRRGHPRSRIRRRSRSRRRRGRAARRPGRAAFGRRGSRSPRSCRRSPGTSSHSSSTSPIIRRSPATVSCGKSPTPGSDAPWRSR